VIAITRGENAELAEDVIPKSLIEEDDEAPAHQSDNAAQQPDRVVYASPAPEVPGRDHPGDPVPGTLPRE
jgi:hypothetical protein